VDPEVLTIALLVLVPAVLLWGIFLLRNRMARQPGALLGIPRAMRPGQPDALLEGSRLERVQVGGLVFTLVLAFFIPMYWLPEASRQAGFEERFEEEAVTRGRLIFQEAPQIEEDADPALFKEEEKAIALGMACVNCHGAVSDDIPREDWAGGGVVPEFQDPGTGEIVAYQAPPLQNVFQRWDEEIVRQTIEQGRPGTPMPAWGVDFGGPMTSQMVDDVMAFLETLPGNNQPPEGISESCENPSRSQAQQCGKEIFDARCAVCHGPEGQGKESQPWYQGMALWKGDVRHLPEELHRFTIINGRRFAFMPPFGEAPAQGIPAPPYPLTDKQIEAVMQYERDL
jgi:mono/diheme cytochrome c family protein